MSTEYEKSKKKEDHIRDAWWMCPFCGQTVPTVNKDIHLNRKHTPSSTEPKWVMSKEAKERVEQSSLKKFTPEQREDLKKLSKLIEKVLSGDVKE